MENICKKETTDYTDFFLPVFDKKLCQLKHIRNIRTFKEVVFFDLICI